MDTQEKCETCMIRYICEEQAGYDCRHNNYRDYMEDSNVVVRKLCKNKKNIGMLVYPVAYENIPNGLRQRELFGIGIFFTDRDEGYAYQEKMNQTDNEYAFWSNKIIPYIIKD